MSRTIDRGRRNNRGIVELRRQSDIVEIRKTTHAQALAMSEDHQRLLHEVEHFKAQMAETVGGMSFKLLINNRSPILGVESPSRAGAHNQCSECTNAGEG
jgi:hypothetical protein